MTMKS
jgi:D-alanyl-D-alanine carboxypeptidase